MCVIVVLCFSVAGLPVACSAAFGKNQGSSSFPRSTQNKSILWVSYRLVPKMALKACHFRMQAVGANFLCARSINGCNSVGRHLRNSGSENDWFDIKQRLLRVKNPTIEVQFKL